MCVCVCVNTDRHGSGYSKIAPGGGWRSEGKMTGGL